MWTNRYVWVSTLLYSNCMIKLWVREKKHIYFFFQRHKRTWFVLGYYYDLCLLLTTVTMQEIVLCYQFRKYITIKTYRHWLCGCRCMWCSSVWQFDDRCYLKLSYLADSCAYKVKDNHIWDGKVKEFSWCFPLGFLS